MSSLPVPQEAGSGILVTARTLSPGPLEDVLSSFEAVLRGDADPAEEWPEICSLMADSTGTPVLASAEGAAVLVKPNMVRHLNALPGAAPDTVIADPRVVLPIVCMALTAAGRSGRVVLGDSPMHDCDTEAILERWGWARILESANRAGYDLAFVDFRRRSLELREGLVVGARELPGDPAGYVLCDLAGASAFENAGIRSRTLRGATPDSRETKEHHSGGRHEYLLSGTYAKSDIIIFVSKLKTHNKIGITGALKNMVGLVGEKNWLPHWRTGFRSSGGDQYARISPASLVRFAVVSAIWPLLRFGAAARAASSVARVFHRAGMHGFAGGGMWKGNDTTWRMVCDVARASVCCDREGLLGAAPFSGRRILHVMDALTAGEGEGPLAPSPVQTGYCLASADPVALDMAACRLAGIDAADVPYIGRILQEDDVPFTGVQCSPVIFSDGVSRRGLDEIRPVCSLKPPAGWARADDGSWDWGGRS